MWYIPYMFIKNPKKSFIYGFWKIKEYLAWDYYYRKVPGKKVQGRVEIDTNTEMKIIEDFVQNGIEVIDYRINPKKYRKFMDAAHYGDYLHYYGGGRMRNFVEKSLEHYLAAEFLDLSKDDIYIDIANDYSPSPEIYQNLYKCKVYRQDLAFKSGIHGNVIGCDAGNMPIPNNFCTKMAMHCSFEHFEGDSDMLFIKEASRILKNEGKLVIVPLYLSKEYSIQTNPVVLPSQGIDFEKDAIIHCVKGWMNRHARFYNVSEFIERIKNPQLRLTIYHILNSKDIDQECYVKFLAVFVKLDSSN